MLELYVRMEMAVQIEYEEMLEENEEGQGQEKHLGARVVVL